MHKHSSTTGVNQTNLTADLNSWNAQVEMLNGMDDDAMMILMLLLLMMMLMMLMMMMMWMLMLM
jgi:ATP-dependent Zn protease